MAKIIQNINGAKAFAGKASKAKGVKGKEIVVAKNLDDVAPAEEEVVVSDGAGQAPGEGRIVLAQANTAASAGGAGGAAAPAEAGAAGTATGAEAGTTASAAAAGGAIGGVAAISDGMMALVGVGLAAVAVGVAAGSNSDSTPAAAPAAAADTTAPDAPLALDLAAADDSGSLNTDNITRNTTGLTISGTAEAGSTVRIYDTDGTTLLGTGTATNGTFTIDVSLAAGDHTLTAKATDAAGNASVASAGLSITVDTTAPVIQSMTSAGNQVVLTYDSPLDGANIPVAGDFAVTVGGVPNAVTNVAVVGVTVTLTLTAAVIAGDAVQVTYTDPTAGDDAAATQDVAGNDAVGFTSGVVADGYVHGAQIYIDTDNDGVADPGEAVSGVVTDAAGNFFLPAGSPTGTIIAVGGVNDSGLLNTIPLKAPTGSTMVTPLTTLVQAYIEANVGTTVADASAAIVTALSLPGGTDLTTYDPIAVLATAPADATALAVQKAAVQVATVVALAAAAPITVTGEQAAITVVENLVTQMGAPTAITPIDLTAGAVITTALGTVSSAALADITTATTAIDGAANLSQVVLAQSVALDTLAPSAPALDLVAGSDTGSSTTDNITNDTTPTIRVSFDAIATDGTAAAAGDTVTVLEGATQVGTAILTATNFANGYVDVTLSTPLAGESAHTLTATLTDIAANASTASTGLAITLDTVVPAAPTVALTTDSGAADTITNVGTLNITGTETGATIQYSTDGGTTWTSSFTATEGPNSVQVRQSDVAGNASTASTLAFTLDTTIATPTVALTTNSGSTSDTITNSAALTFSATAADVTRTFTVDSGAASGSYTAPTTDGTYTVTVTDTDTAGNTANASTTFTLDTAAPTLSSTTPADGAIDVVGNSIVLTFAEAVAAGTGNIVLSDGTTPTNIPVTDSQVAISGNTVTITPTLSPNTTYAVTIASGVITDVAGNAFAGIASGALDFTMANNPSVTVTTSEADNLLNVGDTAAITFTLSEASSNFTAADVTVTGGTLSNFSGTGTTYTATLTPTTSSTTAATVSVDSGVFTSATGLGNIASTPLSINVDTVPPATPTVALTTNSGSTSDSITNNAALTFSAAAGGVTRSISVDSGAGSAAYTAPTTDGAHTVTVTDTDTAGNTASASITFTLDTTIATPTVALTTNSGSTADSITNSAALTVSTAAADVTRTYTVDSGAAGSSYTAPTTAGSHTVTVTDTDTAGNTANASITFTLDTTAPTLSSSTPADNATGVPPSGNIVLTFSENVAAGTGNIVVSDGTNSTTISVTDTSQVTFSGTTVTINPTDDASPSTSYYVQLAGGVITDTAGNAYAGIADTTTLNFTTAAAPTITSSLDNVTNFEVTSNIVLSASENVTAVAGKFITIINDGGAGFHGEATVNTQQILVTDTSKVTITNDTITINPGFDLDFANDYHIMVDSGAFLGVTSGQGSVATADAAAMNFSTVNPSATATAAASQMMASGTDAMVAGHNWWDAEGNGSPATSSVARDFSGGDYAVTANDLATTGIATNDFYIAVNNFGTGDLIYFDNHGDNAVQRQADFDAGMIIDFGTPPTVISAAASGTATGTNGGQFDVTLEGALVADTFSDTAALQTLLNVSYQPILYG